MSPAHHGTAGRPGRANARHTGWRGATSSNNAVDLAEAAGAAQAERVENSGLVARTKARYEAVQALKAQGKGIKPIMRELGLAKETVRRFYRAPSVEELVAAIYTDVAPNLVPMAARNVRANLEKLMDEGKVRTDEGQRWELTG